MELSQYFSVLILILSMVQWRSLEACSCAPKHPQEHYCKADFVILATPKSVNRDVDETVYMLKIRNKFKMTEKAKLALKSGRLVTSPEESMCGVNLNLNSTYIITGSITNLEAKINLCNSYVKLWKTVTPRQRKGFKMLYGQGCECKIKQCSSPDRCSAMRTMHHTCKWLNKSPSCHSDFGICLTNKVGKCNWAVTRKLKNCLHTENLRYNFKPPRLENKPIF